MSTRVDKPRSTKANRPKQAARPPTNGRPAPRPQAGTPPPAAATGPATAPRTVSPAPGARPATNGAVSVEAVRDAKREARMQRQAEARAAASRRQMLRTLRWIGIGALVVLVIGAFIVWQMLQEASKPGQKIAQITSPHVLPGQGHAAYSTDPPTSGPHVSEVPNWAVYTEPMTKELQVHGLEDGGVVINYRPDLDQATLTQLTTLAQDYLGQDSPRNRILVSPYPGLAHPIVLTAWTRMDNLDTFDYARIRKFVDAYVGIDHHEGSPGREFP